MTAATAMKPAVVWRTLRREPGPRLLLESAVMLPAIVVALKLVPFRKLRQWLVRTASIPQSGSGATVSNVVRALDVVSRRLPKEPTCLSKALAAHYLLARRNVGSTIVIGVAKESTIVIGVAKESTIVIGVAKEPSAASLKSHAWLEVGGRVVLGGPKSEVARYVPITFLPSVDREPQVPLY